MRHLKTAARSACVGWLVSVQDSDCPMSFVKQLAKPLLLKIPSSTIVVRHVSGRLGFWSTAVAEASRLP